MASFYICRTFILSVAGLPFVHFFDFGSSASPLMITIFAPTGAALEKPFCSGPAPRLSCQAS